MVSIEQRVNMILTNLEQIKEDLLALSDDIWLSINHNDNTELKQAMDFKSSYNEKLISFNRIASDISALVRDFIIFEDEPKVETREEQIIDDSGEKGIKQLDNHKPHSINENFTYEKPYAFILKEVVYKEVRTWKKFYELICRQLAKENREIFLQLPTIPVFKSNRGNVAFSQDPNQFREPLDVSNGVYTEANLSANSMRDKIKQLLEIFHIPHDRLIICLRDN